VFGTEPERTWLLEKNEDLVFLTYWTQTLIFLPVLDTNSYFLSVLDTNSIRSTNNFFFFLKQGIYIKLASRLIKNLPVPLGTLVRKRVRLKLAA
jgi:hypothetical protein